MVSPVRSGPSFKPRLGVVGAGSRPRLGPGNPPGVRKGQLRLAETACDVRASPTPPPPRHVGVAASGEGLGVRADSGCPPSLSRQLGSPDAILLGQIFHSSQIPLHLPPERQLFRRQMRWLNPPSWSFRRPNQPRASERVGVCLCVCGLVLTYPCPLPFDPCPLQAFWGTPHLRFKSTPGTLGDLVPRESVALSRNDTATPRPAA